MCGETFLNLFSRLSITVYDTGTSAGGRFMNLVGLVIASRSFLKRRMFYFHYDQKFGSALVVARKFLDRLLTVKVSSFVTYRVSHSITTKSKGL